MSDRGMDGAARLKNRLQQLVDFVQMGKYGARHVKEIQGYMLLSHGVTPKKTTEYLHWLEIYGKIRFTNVARNRVKVI